MAESQSDVVAGATPPDLTRLFSPRGIAIVGASEDPRRIGGQPVKGLTQYGYQGSVYPVNPGHATIQGLKAYSDIRDVPQPCDVALIALPADKVPDGTAQ